MSTLSASTHVAAPLERTFEVLTDLGQAAERIPDITALEVLSEGPFGQGTRVSWTFKGTPLTFGAKLSAPIFGLLFKGLMKTCMQRDLDALRAASEDEAARDAAEPPPG